MHEAEHRIVVEHFGARARHNALGEHERRTLCALFQPVRLRRLALRVAQPEHAAAECRRVAPDERRRAGGNCAPQDDQRIACQADVPDRRDLDALELQGHPPAIEARRDAVDEFPGEHPKRLLQRRGRQLAQPVVLDGVSRIVRIRMVRSDPRDERLEVGPHLESEARILGEGHGDHGRSQGMREARARQDAKTADQPSEQQGNAAAATRTFHRGSLATPPGLVPLRS